MHLSRKDRVLFINQYSILKHVDPAPYNARHYDELIKILTDGYEVFYSELDQWISDDMPAEEGRFVLDVLDLYRRIENYKRDNPEDEEITSHTWAKFRGFDGNDETQYLGFTAFLINDQGKFQEQKPYEKETDGWNSHSPTLDKYRKMVRKKKSMDLIEPSREQILELLNA